MKKNPLLFCILLLPVFVLAGKTEEVRVKQILDANLFVLDDGRLVRLADIIVPSLHGNNVRKAKEIIRFAEENLLHEPLQMKKADTEDTDTLSVYLYRKFVFETVYYNLLFVEKGFAQVVEGSPLAQQIYLSKLEKLREQAKRDSASRNRKPSELVRLFSNARHGLMLSYFAVPSQKSNENIYGFNALYEFVEKKYRVSFSYVYHRDIRHAMSVNDENSDDLNYLFSIQYSRDYNYFSFSLGGFVYKRIKGSGPDALLLPMLGIKVGEIKTYYLSVDFIDGQFPGYFNVAFTYHLGDYFNRISLGAERITIRDGESPPVNLYGAVNISFRDVLQGRLSIGSDLTGLNIVYRVGLGVIL